MATDPLTGPALPATRTAGSYFSPKTGVDAVWSKMLISILTPVGARVGNRSFGCPLSDELFGMLDDDTKSLIDYHIRTTLGTYVPEVEVDTIDVSREGQYGISVRIAFYLRTTGERAERSSVITPN